MTAHAFLDSIERAEELAIEQAKAEARRGTP